MSNFDDVGWFHKKFDLPVSQDAPRDVPKDLLQFRIKFMQEELDEFATATTAADQFDALLDLVYVAMGTAHIMGFPWEAGWSRVQQANMAKVRASADASDSKRGSSWDVVKPEGWRAPDIEGLLDTLGWPTFCLECGTRFGENVNCHEATIGGAVVRYCDTVGKWF